MGERRNESEFDELEQILGEIPNVTGNQHPEHVGLKNSSVDDEKMSVTKTLQLPSLDQSLTSAFSELSFGDGVKIDASNPSFAVHESLPNYPTMSDEQYQNSLYKCRSIMDSRILVVPSLQSPPNSCAGLQRSTQECSNMLRLDTPFSHGLQGFQFFPDMSVPHVEYPVIANQHQYFLEAQRLSHPFIRWKEEQYYSMHQQHLYFQQLRSQSLEAQSLIQANENAPTRVMSWNPIQPYDGVPNSNEHGRGYQIPRRNTFAAISPADCHTPRILDKVNTQFFPEKILTRSHGLNSIRSAEFGYESPIDKNGTALFYGKSLSPPNMHLRMQPRRYNFLDEEHGKIYLMAKDQNGCRYLQRKFTEGTRDDVEKIFLEIIDRIVELMTDPFGNYLVQKLLDVCGKDQRMQILRAITRKPGDLVKISCDLHGTRAVQKVIETLETREQFSIIVSSLKPGIVALIKNMNGNHVAQCCLQYLTPEDTEFLYEAATANCVELATDRHGCCVLQKCLVHSKGVQQHRLICKITSNALILSQDPYGNYVLQFVFELEVPWATKDILNRLQGNYGDLSTQKFSSNVVEKCLKHAGEENRLDIIKELIENPRFDQIMLDPYGNYVIQASLNHSKGAPLHTALAEAIRPHIPALRTSPYGKKILSSYSLKK